MEKIKSKEVIQFIAINRNIELDSNEVSKIFNLTFNQLNIYLENEIGLNFKELILFIDSINLQNINKKSNDLFGNITYKHIDLKDEDLPNNILIQPLVKLKNLIFNYSIFESKYGKVLVSSSNQFITNIEIIENEELGLKYLQKEHPNVNFQMEKEYCHVQVENFFNHRPSEESIRILVKGTDFQIKVWNSLLHIKKGTFSTYQNIGKKLGLSNHSRAIGNAIGSNPCAILIPCHRVIRGDMGFGGFKWGLDLKIQLLKEELLR